MRKNDSKIFNTLADYGTNKARQDYIIVTKDKRIFDRLGYNIPKSTLIEKPNTKLLNVKFSFLNTLVHDNYKLLLKRLVDNGIVTERQFVRIVQKSLKLNSNSTEVYIKHGINKIIVVLHFLSENIAKRKYKNELKNSIKRLMSNNGNETLNELISHVGLINCFKKYRVLELFSNAPDGEVINSKLNIPVEIKSRLPNIFVQLDYFFEEVSKICPRFKNVNIEVLFNVTELNLKITNNNIKSLIDFFKAKLGTLQIDNIPYYPKGLTLSFETEDIKGELTIVKRKSKPNKIFGLPKKWNSLFYTSQEATYNNKKFHNFSLFGVLLSTRLNDQLSKILIDDCIKRIKNLPNEPRIIAIYSDLFSGDQLNIFFEKTIEKYINKKKGTCVIGICSSFNVDSNQKLYFKIIKAGSSIKNSIKEALLSPNSLK